MKIPQNIYDVLNNRNNFDKIFLEKLKEHSSEDAYDAAIDYVRQYAPKFKYYKDFDSYRVMLSQKNNKEIDIPKEIIHAVTYGIEDLFHKHLKKVKIRKRAYDLTVQEINKYLPHYKPYRNYQTFKSMQSHRHKQKQHENRKNSQKKRTQLRAKNKK